MGRVLWADPHKITNLSVIREQVAIHTWLEAQDDLPTFPEAVPAPLIYRLRGKGCFFKSW